MPRKRPCHLVLGDVAEHEAMKRLYTLGLHPYHVFGLPHDIQVGRLFLQIKSTATRHKRGGYSVGLQKNDGGGRLAPRYCSYTRKDADFVLVWVQPLDQWYIFPAEVFISRIGVRVMPGTGSRWEEYVERWDLIKAAL